MRGRPPLRRQTLTPGERTVFDFLFQRLALIHEDERPDLDTLLEQLKAKGVALKPLGEVLLAQLALDQFNPRRAREAVGAFLDRLEAFERERKRLRGTPASLLDATKVGVRPPAFAELLDALAAATSEAEKRARRLMNVLERRTSKKGAPPRELLSLPQGIGPDHARKLHRVVRVAARTTPLGVPLIQYGGPPRCSQCGNPAPLLFRSR